MSSLEQLIGFAQRQGLKWTSRKVGALAFLSGAVPTFLAANGLSDGSRLGTATVFASLAGSALLVAWILSCRPPRTPRGRIGIAFAISVENDSERVRLKTELMEQIVTRLEHRPSAVRLKVIEVPNYLAPAVTDKESAEEMCRRCRARILIWGAVRTRRSNGKDVLVVRLEGRVSHKPTAIVRSQALSQEMRSAVPERTEIDLADELHGFEATSENLASASKFILALADAVSNDWAGARALLLEVFEDQRVAPRVQKQKKKKQARTPTALGFRKSLPQHLAGVCYADYLEKMIRWTEDRSNTALLHAAEQALVEHRRFLVMHSSEGPAYWISQSAIEVSIRRNFAEAETLLLKCRAVALHDPTWRLSLAFVLTLKGDLDAALDQYDAALSRNPDARLILDIEAYVQWWIKDRDGPPGLLLLSALLNQGAKKDGQLAAADLDLFLERQPEPLSPMVERKVREVQRELALSNSL